MGFNSGFKGLIVSIRHLVYVTVCRWPSGTQVWFPPKPAYQTVRCRIDTINSPDDEHTNARNMQRIGIKIYGKKKRIVRQVGHLQELYW